MKVPLHYAIESYEDALDFEDDKQHLCVVNGVVYLLPSECSYELLEDSPHTTEGECMHCDYKRVEALEKGLCWSESTEYWDYFDWWLPKFGLKEKV